MTLPDLASRDEWLQARKALLADEKAMTRVRDQLNVKRRQLPMVEITKDYELTGPDGSASLLDLFAGHRQLIVGHFMFDPSWEDGCPSCSAGADEMSGGMIEHLRTRETNLAYVSRAPVDKIEAYKAQRGWTFDWYSSFGTDFNYDFGVTIDELRGADSYNFKSKAQFEADGQGDFFDADQPFEMPGTSFFLRDVSRVFHTYSSYARGAEATGGSYYYLDLTALGRQEDWEEPKGRSDDVRGNQPDFQT